MLLLDSFLATFGRQASGVITRQQDINETYGSLVQAAAERKKRLKDAIRQFKMFRDCDELESWIKEKGVVMSAEEKGTGKEKVEAMHKKFEVNIYEFLGISFSKDITSFVEAVPLEGYILQVWN